ncbi:unnamed protein product [Peniophora sp. CBMAI 1063]|nr:unnamed protein product [Peniophora sp. CBMAI 1063]
MKKRKTAPTAVSAPTSKRVRSESSELEEEEWTGFGASLAGGGSSGEGSDEDEDLIGDDGYTACGSVAQPEVVVFSESQDAAAPRPTKSQTKAFMSSKVSKLRTAADLEYPPITQNREDEDDERTNAQNDAALHKLVHTQLLSGSLDRSLNLTSSQRKKALQGRVLELAGAAKLGKGEKAVRKKEHARASKAVRDGMEDRRIERKGKALAETKDMGNWHPSIKKLLADEDESSHSRKREKGLRMGVVSRTGCLMHNA